MTWQDRAACVGAPDEVFFPTATTPHMWDEARAYCAACPVTVDCLADALLHTEWGMRGGLTPDEQRNLKRRQSRQRNADAIIHGQPCRNRECAVPLVPRRPETAGIPPAGHAWHGGKGLCRTCYRAQVSA